MSSPLYLQYKAQIDQIASYYNRHVVARGFTATVYTTPTNWYEITVKFVGSVMVLIMNTTNTPAEKKQAVIDAATDFWKQNGQSYAANLIGSPFIFNSLIEPVIEPQIPTIIGGIYDALMAVMAHPPAAARAMMGVHGAQGQQGQSGPPIIIY